MVGEVNVGLFFGCAVLVGGGRVWRRRVAETGRDPGVSLAAVGALFFCAFAILFLLARLLACLWLLLLSSLLLLALFIVCCW